MKKLFETFVLPINITIPKNSPIENLDSSIYNSQSLVETCDIICVGNGRFFYFNEDGKLDIYVIVKIRYPVIKKIISSFHLMHCNELENIICKWLLYFNFLGYSGMVLGCYRKTS